jgi:hypothetical protein
MKKQTKRPPKAKATAADQLYYKAVHLARELAVRVFARRHGLSYLVARDCVAAIGSGDSEGDRAAWDALLIAGQKQLSVELGILPTALDAWFDGGYEAPDAYPQLVHLERIEQALSAAA